MRQFRYLLGHQSFGLKSQPDILFLVLCQKNLLLRRRKHNQQQMWCYCIDFIYNLFCILFTFFPDCISTDPCHIAIGMIQKGTQFIHLRSRICQQINAVTVSGNITQCLIAADKPCIVAIDEFQQIAKYPEKNIEALLRTHIQKIENSNFIFAGSERHMMQEMFLSSSRPFYHSADILELKAIAPEIYIPFIADHFQKRKRHIEIENIENRIADGSKRLFRGGGQHRG